ncbi:MAG TPA: class I SAM-dependent methyltransferase [Oculatellaceae cyanobacterium]
MSVERNPYGDELKSVLTGFGSDVSSQRLTPFEEEILRRAALLKQACAHQPVALDIFSGYCAANALRFAKLGFAAYAVDFSPPDESLAAFIGVAIATDGGADGESNADGEESGILHYLQQDVRKVDLDSIPSGIDLVTCQRGLHFLHFAEAVDLVSALAQHLNSGASMFFSIGAVDCAVGPGYKHADKPVSERWHPLEEELGAPIHVTAPLCLYKEEDITALFAGLDGEIISVERDDFGLFIVEFRKN